MWKQQPRDLKRDFIATGKVQSEKLIKHPSSPKQRLSLPIQEPHDKLIWCSGPKESVTSCIMRGPIKAYLALRPRLFHANPVRSRGGWQPDDSGASRRKKMSYEAAWLLNGS